MHGRARTAAAYGCQTPPGFDSRPDSTSCAARRRAAVVVLLSRWAANQQTCAGQPSVRTTKMAPSLAGAAQDLRDELGAVDVHSDISEPDTSDDEVARAAARAKRTASKDLESRMARIREQGKNKPPTKPHWTRARPRTTGRARCRPPRRSCAARSTRTTRPRRPRRRRPSGAGPTRRRCRARAQRDANHARGSSEAAVSPEPPVLSWRRGDEVSCKFRATGKWVDATVLGPAAATAKGPAGYDVKYEDGGVVERHVPPTLLRPREGAERDAGPSKGFGRVDAAAAPAAAAPKPPRPARPAPPRPKAAQEAKAARRRTSRKTQRPSARSEGAAARKCGAGCASRPAGAQAGY